MVENVDVEMTQQLPLNFIQGVQVEDVQLLDAENAYLQLLSHCFEQKHRKALQQNLLSGIASIFYIYLKQKDKQ
jgi:hypothetical protein